MLALRIQPTSAEEVGMSDATLSGQGWLAPCKATCANSWVTCQPVSNSFDRPVEQAKKTPSVFNRLRLFPPKVSFGGSHAYDQFSKERHDIDRSRKPEPGAID
jgi:hypothetical protein